MYYCNASIAVKRELINMQAVLFINPFNASCFKLLLFEGFSAILV